MLFYMILYKHKKKEKKFEIVISKLEIMTWITILNNFLMCQNSIFFRMSDSNALKVMLVPQYLTQFLS